MHRLRAIAWTWSNHQIGVNQEDGLYRPLLDPPANHSLSTLSWRRIFQPHPPNGLSALPTPPWLHVVICSHGNLAWTSAPATKSLWLDNGYWVSYQLRPSVNFSAPSPLNSNKHCRDKGMWAPFPSAIRQFLRGHCCQHLWQGPPRIELTVWIWPEEYPSLQIHGAQLTSVGGNKRRTN